MRTSNALVRVGALLSARYPGIRGGGVSSTLTPPPPGTRRVKGRAPTKLAETPGWKLRPVVAEVTIMPESSM
jgi:hypothetical protein